MNTKQACYTLCQHARLILVGKADELMEQLVERKDVSADMKQQYDSINSIQSCTIRKVQIKNVGKNGEKKKVEYQIEYSL